MGYRSVVEAVFYTRDKEQAPLLKLYVDENFPKNEELRECLTPIKANSAWGYHFVCGDVKWYESYSEIREFNEFAEKFISFGKDTNWSYEFVRIGEETEDIEEERSENADFILCVRREIELNI